MPKTPNERHGLVGSPTYWKLKRNFQYSFLIEHGLERRDRLLDYGCGTLRGGLPLIRYLMRGHYVGVDVREEVIIEAELEVHESRLQSQQARLVHIPDAMNVPDGPYDVIWIFDTMIHLSDDIAESVFKMCYRCLEFNGCAYFNANVHEEEMEDMAWREFPVVFRPHSFYQDLADAAGLDIQKIGTLGELGHDNGDALQSAQTMYRLMLKDTERV